jgi:hypothetical protein
MATDISRIFRVVALTVVALVFAAPAAAAPALVAPSANWAGFIAGGPGVRFRSVSASWRQPAPRCNGRHVATTSTWIGLGGVTGRMLEQTGTQLFCAHGRTATLAWYEILPAPAVFLGMPVRPGDVISARVTVIGHRVSFLLRDVSEGESFSHTFRARRINTDSADWIQEAPSLCSRSGSCHPVRLANFGTIHFSSARAQGARGHFGSIAARLWQHIRLVLIQATHSFINVAVPSRLGRHGSAFTVTYRPVRG